MNYPLLGKHKPSPEWYTPRPIWEKIYNTFGTKSIFDPCPPGGSNGLTTDWEADFIYVNPPTPARLWAEKVIATFRSSPTAHIIYAAFSESVLWQVPQLMTYPTVFVRHRIKWDTPYANGKRNAPRNYNAFVLLGDADDAIAQRFKVEFGSMGFYGRISNLNEHMNEINRWQINPSYEGFPGHDDWHHGLNDFSNKQFPQHLSNKLYMLGWMYEMGMHCGYENYPATLNEAQYIEGWQIAQHERYCHNQETILKFE